MSARAPTTTAARSRAAANDTAPLRADVPFNGARAPEKSGALFFGAARPFIRMAVEEPRGLSIIGSAGQPLKRTGLCTVLPLTPQTQGETVLSNGGAHGQP